ncbi:hypothetical protein LIER_03146 [Lithospermum erythrorhizon]|uniref:Retrotransposon gag domain-containing protein n=1 Tax=Lithospermum erythrorhizon TaxID=34254 RepID=A0AAV3NUU5_LITER
MMIALEAMDKLGFINGEIEVPDVNDPRYKQWRKSSASELWKKINEQFGGCSRPRLYELRRSIYSRQYVNEEKIMQFLMGLREKYDATRNQVLLMDHLPSMTRAYSMMVQVEQQRVLYGVD